jgi:hypothetical protein
VYTTRPDTLFGATYLVLAPEHPALAGLASEAKRAEVTAYAEAAARKSDLERTELQKDKSGVFTGARAAAPPGPRALDIAAAELCRAAGPPLCLLPGSKGGRGGGAAWVEEAQRSCASLAWRAGCWAGAGRLCCCWAACWTQP